MYDPTSKLGLRQQATAQQGRDGVPSWRQKRQQQQCGSPAFSTLRSNIQRPPEADAVAEASLSWRHATARPLVPLAAEASGSWRCTTKAPGGIHGH